MRMLAVSSEPSRYTPLESWTYELRSARKIAPGLWQLHQNDDGTNLDGARELVWPLVRSASLEGLLAAAAGARLPPRWNLRYTSHARDGRRAAPFRACGRPTRDAGPGSSDILCVVAAALPGAPSLDAAERLLLLRTPRLWYLGVALDRVSAAVAKRSAATDVWRRRPYSFSAATDPQLARHAVSLACAHHVRSGKCLRGGALLDPCCGSGTVLYAARLRGLDVVGFDVNPKAVEGTESNMQYLGECDLAGLMDDSLDPCATVATIRAPLGVGARAEPAAKGHAPDVAPRTTRVLRHDCTSGPPPASAIASVCLVVASLPWGRNQRIPRAGYLSELLRPLALALPNATFCLTSSDSLEPEFLSNANLVLHRSQSLGARCVVSVLTPHPPIPVPPVAPAEPLSRRPAAPEPPHASTASQPNLVEQVEVIGGGGLRSGRGAQRMPSEGDVIEVQCRRASGGRAWFSGTVVHLTRVSSMLGSTLAEREGGLATCRLNWHDVQSHIREPVTGLPEELGLGLYDGPNWRFLMD